MNLLYLIGGPGAGKSTLMGELTGGCGRRPGTDPIAHDILTNAAGDPVGVELGRRRDDFPGTDALPMNVSPAACIWVQSGLGPGLLLAEGDRLAHMRFFDAARAGGYRVTVAYLDASGGLLASRCAARGAAQDTSWRKGRASKAARLAEIAPLLGHTVLTLDASQPPAILVKQLRRDLPALAVLPGAP